MPTPPMSLEQAVSQHGDTLYRIALLLTDDAGRAGLALRRMVQRSAAQSDLPTLLHVLFAVLDEQRHARRWPWQRRRSRRFTTDGPLYRGPGVPSPFTSLPFEQRQVLALHLLANDEPIQIAQILGRSEEQIRNELADALVALATAGGIRLPSATSNEQCVPVRELLMRAPDQLATDPLLRGHLALCSLCRAFEATWATLIQQAETALRNGLRAHTIPRTLATALATASRQTGRERSWWDELFAGGKTSFIAIPLIVLLLIGALVLPGFLQSAPQQPVRSAVAPAQSRALVQQALTLIDQPPAGAGVWHAQWETLWYFPNGSYAPIIADAWLDTNVPARHRLQAVHGGGGALYELQIGDGAGELWYALGSTYYSSLYGDVETAPTQPQLIRRGMDAAAQRQAVSARLRAGVWNIGPTYLRLAYNAPELRTLGRQPLDGHTVQIISFVGTSPLGFPSDDTRAANVTILLGIDSDDGRLRSVTELAGPPGGEQTSKVTWHLRSEAWLHDEQEIRQTFDARQAWNGRGSFPAKIEGASIDSRLLLYDPQYQFPLEQLIAAAPLAPNGPPPGAERLITQRIGDGTTLVSSTLTYVGEGRQLALSWRQITDSGAFETIGTLQARIVPARNQHYHAIVAPPAPRDSATLGILIDAQGFSRAELTAFISKLGPLTSQGWKDQQALIGPSDPLHETLVMAITQSVRPTVTQAMYRRERVFMRHSGLHPSLPDPYHIKSDDRYPRTAVREQWTSAGETGATPEGQMVRVNRFQVDNSVYAIQYSNGRDRWSFRPGIKLIERWPTALSLPLDWRSEREQAASLFLNAPATANMTSELHDGNRILMMTTPLQDSIFSTAAQQIESGEDLPTIPKNTTHIITELSLDQQNRPIALRYSAIRIRADGAKSPPERLASWELEDERLVEFGATPIELHSGTVPTWSAVLVNNYNSPPSDLSVRTATISEALEFFDSPLLVLPADNPTRLQRIEICGNQAAAQYNPIGGGAVERGLAVQLTYDLNGDWRQTLQLTEGPTELLRTYLRAQPATWVKSTPMRVVVAGQEVRGWLLESTYATTKLIVEIDGTLIIAEGNPQWFNEMAIPLLEALQVQE